MKKSFFFLQLRCNDSKFPCVNLKGNKLFAVTRRLSINMSTKLYSYNQLHRA